METKERKGLKEDEKMRKKWWDVGVKENGKIEREREREDAINTIGEVG